MYNSDSLCILHLKIGEKENATTVNEYCYLTHHQKNYELLGIEGGVFKSEDDYKKENSDKSYDEYIYRKAVEAINRSGFLVGKPFERLTDKISLAGTVNA